jgi:uncharacterized membrane protein
MAMLVLGVLIFAGVHLVPSLAPGLRANWVARLGENGYKGLFSLLLLTGMGLIVAGWRSTLPSLVYMPVPELRHPGMGLILIAFLLMVVSGRPSRIKSVIRHPQLTGVLVWAAAHLMINGENRSVILFSGLGLWALVEIFAINRREGAWVKGDTPPWSAEVVSLAIAAVVIAVIVFVHPWIAGVPVI